MRTIEKQVVHCWKPMEEYTIGENEVPDAGEYDMRDLSKDIQDDRIALQRMQPNQFFVAKGCNLDLGIGGTDLMNTSEFHRYISNLRKKGFDISNDEHSKYGYKMPLPKRGETSRRLIIFRRH